MRRFAAVLPLILALLCAPVHGAERMASRSEAARPVKQQPVKQAKRKKSVGKARVAAAAAGSAALASRPAKAETLSLKSNAALVVDQDTGELVAAKNADLVVPIASLTKLMTGLVVVDSHLPMDEELEISSEDIDTERNTHSRLGVGTRLRRDELLLLALMSSENRAAMALSRNYPGGRPAFLAQMNEKARALGMHSSHFADPAGLSNQSMSTANDLHKLLNAAYSRPLIRSYTTQVESTVVAKGRLLTFINSNRLVRSSDNWDIELQKTGFTNEAGRCLVMQVNVKQRRLAMIFLDSNGTMTRYADAARVRKRVEREADKPRPKLVSVGSPTTVTIAR